MTDLASKALASALQLEVKKDGLQQRQNGAWVLRLSVHPDDLPVEVMKAAMGTRYVCVLVEVGDDEQPKGGDTDSRDVRSSTTQPHKTPPAPLPDKPAGRAKRSWDELSAAEQAGIRCNEPAFHTFLTSKTGVQITDVEMAAKCVRLICCVKTRADIKPGNPRAMTLWTDLDNDYRIWQFAPAVVG